MALNPRRRDDAIAYAETAEINVTPFIDVILVLLIIFMVAAPLSTVNVPLDLPVSSAKPPPVTAAEPIVLSIQADRHWSVGEDRVDSQSLGATINARSKGDRDVRIFVRADKTVPYESLMQAMDALRTLGYLKMSLVGLEKGEGV